MKPILLVVDDQSETHWLYRRILDQSYEILSVYCYSDLIPVLEDGQRPSIALVITDFDLGDPEHDGLDVARLLWQALPGTPTLMMSGFEPAEQPRIQEFLSDPRAHFLKKDAAAQELKEQVSSLVTDAQDAKWNHELKNHIANVSLLEDLLPRARDEKARAAIQERLDAGRERLSSFLATKRRKNTFGL